MMSVSQLRLLCFALLLSTLSFAEAQRDVTGSRRGHPFRPKTLSAASLARGSSVHSHLGRFSSAKTAADASSRRRDGDRAASAASSRTVGATEPLGAIPSRCKALPSTSQSVSPSQTATRRTLLRSSRSKNSDKYRSKGFSAPDGDAARLDAAMMLKRLVGRGPARGSRFMEGWTRVIQPPVSRHSLGSCAVVGLSSRILGSCLGKAIDSHKTVFRFGGAPVKGWERDVGFRKSVQIVRKPSQSGCGNLDHDVWFKGGQIKEANPDLADTRPPDNFYLVLGESHAKCRGKRLNKFNGKPVRYMEPQGQVSTVTTSLYERFIGAIGDGNATALSMQRKMKATSGFNFVMALIISQACRQISLYGFGQGEAGHYFLSSSEPQAAGGPVSKQRRQGMKSVHSLELEHWLRIQAMSAALLCEYDKEGLSVGASC